jgi:hypothetical protein
LSDSGDWGAFNRVFWGVIKDAQNLVRQLEPSRE